MSYVDLTPLSNLTSFRLSSLQYTTASLHLLRGLNSVHLRSVVLDAAFHYLRHFEIKELSEHDSVLSSPALSGLEEVTIRYFGEATLKKAKGKITTVFSKTNQRGLLQVTKISSFHPVLKPYPRYFA